MVTPVLPPAPGMFSVTTCWPHVSDNFCATMRAITSVGPPAANGTIRRTGFAGQPSAAALPAGASIDRMSAAEAANAGNIMASSLDLFFDAIILLARGAVNTDAVHTCAACTPVQAPRHPN